MKFLILYMPVLHKGYLDLFDRVKPDIIGLLAEDVLQTLPDGLAYIAKKDVIRALSSKVMCDVVSSLFSSGVRVVQVSVQNLESTIIEPTMFMPDEDVSIAVAEKYFGGVQAVTLVTPPTRLRYHRDNIEEKKLLVPDRRTMLSALDRDMMALATNVAERSPDWWRQVGGVLVTEDNLHLVAYNELQPHEQIVATFGDPRSIFKSGVRADLSFSDHVEHILVGEAARQGIPTAGAWLYLTTFPCLPCLRLVVRAGVTRLFYRDPSYGLLDADEFLRIKKIELIEVSE